MSNVKILPGGVKYPKKETATAVIPENHHPFYTAVIGVTYPFPDYNIDHSPAGKFTVLEYVLEGEGELFIDGEWITVKGGDVYIFPQGVSRKYHANPKNPYKKIWINYAADYMASLLDAYEIRAGVYHGELAKPYFERALALSKGEIHADTCYQLADCVHKIISLSSSSRSKSKSTAEQIREALNNSIYKKIDLALIAAELHLSKSTLIRSFKKEYGITPYDFLLSSKIETAKVLLCNTEMSIRQISDVLCFTDEHYFSSVFLRRVGLRPRAYREKNR